MHLSLVLVNDLFAQNGLLLLQDGKPVILTKFCEDTNTSNETAFGFTITKEKTHKYYFGPEEEKLSGRIKAYETKDPLYCFELQS